MNNRNAKNRQIIETKSPKGEWLAFFQENKFMGFVEPRGAQEIILSAITYGHEVQSYHSYFNVLVKPS